MQAVRRTTSAPSSPQKSHGAVPALRVTAVLVPAGGRPGPTTKNEAALPRPASQPARSSLRGTLSSLFRGWDSRAPPESVEALVEATTVLEQQADALDEGRERGFKGPADPEPDIRACLRPVGVMETRYVRVLSSLCALTYHLDNLTPSSLLRRHRLKLVTTSKVCDARLREPRLRASDALSEADAMAANPAIVAAAQAEIAASEARALAAPSPAMAAVSRVAPFSSVDLAAAASGASPVILPAAGSSSSSSEAGAPAAGIVVAGSPDASSGLSPVDRVAASLAAAAAAASAAAQGVYTAAVPYAGPLANNITSFTGRALTSALPPVRSVAAQLQSAAAVGHSSAIATVATVTAALESTWSGQSSRLPKECQSPTEWFIADDPSTHTRYFVIQGSDNLDHWRVNLTFDPVPFEEPSLGVKVHRGVYETAEVLYERFLPLVQDHLATSPFAKIAFTGHSLGGSLGSLLMLMYVERGVLPRSAISPVYTFGAPAVFCEGGIVSSQACGCGPPNGGAEEEPTAAAAACGCTGGASCGVLGLMGLPEGAVRNVLMAKDIVPRAFACDYTLVADLLKRVSESFREHRCLNSTRTVMFDFIGKMMVLQPDAAASFVGGEGYHPLLPPTAGLFLVRDPAALSSVAATLKNDASFVQQAMAQAISNLPSNGAAAASAPAAVTVPASNGTNNSGSSSGKPPKAQPPQQLGCPATTAREAVWVLMNRPHPLDTLADPGAYGDLGAISRYHNPDNYTRGLGGVLRARGAAWRSIVARAGNAGIRYFAPALDAGHQRAAAAAPPALPPAQAGSDGSVPPMAGASTSAPSAADRRLSHGTGGGKQSLLPRLSPRSGLPRNGSNEQLA